MKNKSTDNTHKKSPKKGLKIIIIISAVFAFLLAVLLLPNAYVCITSAEYISKEADDFADADCIVVLGCGVTGYTPGPILTERLDKAIELYKNKAAPKLIMSGDHGGEYYNEVGVMKAYAIEQGVDSRDIFMDHAGFSTYDTLYRVKEVFGCKKVIAVTQEYHLYRTVYLGRCLGLDIVGAAAYGKEHDGQFYRDMREILARDKDFFTGIFKPEPSVPTHDKINIKGDGNITNDDAFRHIAEVKSLKY